MYDFWSKDNNCLTEDGKGCRIFLMPMWRAQVLLELLAKDKLTGLAKAEAEELERCIYGHDA